MSDNSIQTGSDSIRALARQSLLIKTQVVQLDIGGASNNPEMLMTAGQQVMAGSLPVVLASNHAPIVTQASPSSNKWGQALSAVAGSTVTINSVTAVTGYRIKGMVCHGTGDGYFTIQVASVTVLYGRIRVSAPVLVLTLPNGIAVNAGTVVTLNVANESGATADYEATLLGE